MSGISEYKQPDKYRCLKVPLSYILRKYNEVDNSGECETLTRGRTSYEQITGKSIFYDTANQKFNNNHRYYSYMHIVIISFVAGFW
jgi:hypothetical protein